MRKTLLSIALLIMVGCGDGQERLKEKAGIEGRANSEAGIAAEEEHLARKAMEMEADLAIRQRFYQGVKGSYEGTLETEDGPFYIRLNLVPSLPPYSTPRVRVLDEITADLNNLYFNIQVVQWNPNNTLSAVGCRVEHVRPDILSGEITIASQNCANFYALRISDPDPTHSSIKSSELASGLRNGTLDAISSIDGMIQPSTNAKTYRFRAKKVSR
ncbi:MAG: hypothetical protein AABZ55_10220 [Bdellovibrionota bacterium]